MTDEVVAKYIAEQNIDQDEEVWGICGNAQRPRGRGRESPVPGTTASRAKSAERACSAARSSSMTGVTLTTGLP